MSDLKARQCPHCGYQYSKFSFFRKIFFKLPWQSWECNECGKSVGLSLARRVLNTLIAIVVLFILFKIRRIFRHTLTFLFLGIIVLFIIIHIVPLFEHLRDADKKDKKK